MNKISKYILSIGLLAGAMTSCQSDVIDEGKGKVSFAVSVNDDVKLHARSTQAYEQNCTIYVYNSSNTLVRKYHGVSEIPAELWLVSDNYRAEAWAGESVPASFTDKYFKGEEPFAISKGSTRQVNIECKIANVVASVKMSPEAESALSNYTVTINNGKGSLDFNSSNADAKGYFTMESGETSLTWTLNGTHPNGALYSQTGTIANVKAAHEYQLTFTYTPGEVQVGGGMFTVVVDESTVDVNDEVLLVAAPKFIGSGFDISEPLVGEYQKFKAGVVYVTSALNLNSLKISSDSLMNLGFPTSEYDYFNMTESAREELMALGISVDYKADPESGSSITKIVFAEQLLNKMKEGLYEFNLSATDVRDGDSGKTNSVVFGVKVSNAMLITYPADAMDVKQYSATLRGKIVKESATGVVFKYRKKGEPSWNEVPAEKEGMSISAKITELTPLTAYQFVTSCDQGESFDIQEFTTGSALELINGGFELWSTASNGAAVPSESGNLFWDSGNHGSITLKKNITEQDNTFKHGGNSSIKMVSQKVALMGIGKFAAGNVFVGKYLETVGTNGVIGFGRAFTSRPVALHGWARYVSTPIAYTSGDVPEASKGTNDRGVVYVALLDGTTQSHNGENWPVVVNTKTKQFFNKTAPNVIGYGEVVWTESTEGTDWVEFTIPITYNDGRLPVNMLLTASASYWGDYFVGGEGSTLWLDDLEFVYE